MTQRYEIEEMLSQDAQGVAFRARDREQKRDVVLRRFFPNGRDGGGLQPPEQEAFLIAVEKLKALKLKELRKTFDGGCDPVDGIPFLVTEWIEGDTLATFTRGKALESASVKDIVEVALKASQQLSSALGHETQWVGCSEDSLIVPESGRGITFWVEPLASLNTRGLLPLAELAERLLGWKGKPAHVDSAGDGLAGWIRQIRANPKGWTLAEALEALHRPVTATATAQIRRAPGAVTARAPAAKRAKPKKSVLPWALSALVLILVGAGAVWKLGGIDRVVERVQAPSKPKGMTREEILAAIAPKDPVPVAEKPAAPPAPTVATPAKAPEPAPPASPAKAVAGPADSIVGKVIDASQSSSGKTRYLEIFGGGQSRWAGYQVAGSEPGLEMADFESWVGKNVRITGEFKKENSFRRDVLLFKKRDQIEVQP